MKHALLAAALSCAPAGHSAWGAELAAPLPDRVIRVTDQTRYVNVMRFETIRFLVSDAQGQERSFDWRVDQFEKRAFPLSDIAPSGLLGNRAVEVYVQRDPPSD